MVRAYGQAWARLHQRLATLVTQAEQAKAKGEPVGPSWLFQQHRLEHLLSETESEIRRFAQYASASVKAEQAKAVEAAQRHAHELTAAALGPGVDTTFAKLPTAALEDLVGFMGTGSPLANLFDQLVPEAREGMRRALVTGLAVGKNPRDVAAAAKKHLGGNLVRALTIARTETLRSYRTATLRSYRHNSDVVGGWVWHSACDRRTCASCWAMHGTTHGLDERLDDHICGRCAAVPITRTYADILGDAGKAADQLSPALKVETGADRFAQLEASTQLTILGPAKHALYASFQITLADCSVRVDHGAWGTMRREATIAEALANAATRKAAAAAAAAAAKAQLAGLVAGQAQTLAQQAAAAAAQAAIAQQQAHGATAAAHAAAVTGSPTENGKTVLAVLGKHAGKTGTVVGQAGGFVKVEFGEGPKLVWKAHLAHPSADAKAAAEAAKKALAEAGLKGTKAAQAKANAAKVVTTKPVAPPVATQPSPVASPQPQAGTPAPPQTATPVVPPPAATQPAPSSPPVPPAVQLPPRVPPVDLAALVVDPAEGAGLGGAHQKTVYRAPDGSLWLFKPQEDFRAELDAAMGRLADLVGYDATPRDVYRVDLGGKSGSLQRMLGAKADLRPAFGKHGAFDPTKLDAADAEAIQRHAVFNWLVGNHDGHPEQFVRRKGDRTVHQVDLGQAFRFFGKDKLDEGFNPNPVTSVANELYAAYAKGGAVPIATLVDGNSQLEQFVGRLSGLDDATYRAVLRPYAELAAKAGSLATAATFKNDADRFLDAAVARKNGLLTDWTAFHGRLEKAREQVLGPQKALPGFAVGAVEFADDAAAADWAKTTWPTTAKAGFPAAELDGLRYYKGNGYHAINHALRSGAPLAGSVKAGVEEIDRALAHHPMPDDAVLWRGVDRNALPADPAAMVGTVYPDEGYMSASIGSTPPPGWQSKRYWLRIRVPKGMPTYYLDHITKLDERELLVPRDGRFYVHRTYPHKTRPGVTVLELEMIGWGQGPVAPPKLGGP